MAKIALISHCLASHNDVYDKNYTSFTKIFFFELPEIFEYLVVFNYFDYSFY